MLLINISCIDDYVFAFRDIEKHKYKMIHRNRSTVICLQDNKILGFHAVDPTSKVKYFFLPGGKIEEGESPAQSALRETLEETGYKIRLFPQAAIVKEYTFPWDGNVYFSKTVFYPAMLLKPTDTPAIVNDAEYHQGVDWVPATEIEKHFGYQKDILSAVQECLIYLKKLK